MIVAGTLMVFQVLLLKKRKFFSLKLNKLLDSISTQLLAVGSLVVSDLFLRKKVKVYRLTVTILKYSEW